MPWMRHRLRDADVWAKVDATGTLIADREGRVEIVYKPEPAAKIYRAGARTIDHVETCFVGVGHGPGVLEHRRGQLITPVI